MKGLAINEGER